MSLVLNDAELREITGYKRGHEQRRWLLLKGVPHYVHKNGRPVVIRSAYERWKNPVPFVYDEPSPSRRPPELDEAAVYLSLDAVRARKRKFTRGMDTPATGVYFLFHDDDLLYIGLSNQVYGRLWSHFIKRVDEPDYAIWFNDVTVIDVPEFWLRRVEEFYIAREQPPRNVKGIR